MLRERKLIIIQWTGGNDGLNTFVPIENDIYFNARPKLHLKKSEVLPLHELYGFNPQLKFLHQLYNQGQLSIINNVGYPNATRSHFHSMDIWQSASLKNDKNLTGWLGRYLDQHKLHFPNKVGAIETSSILSTGLNGLETSGICIDNFSQMRAQLQNPLFSQILERVPILSKQSSHELQHIYHKIDEGIKGIEYLYQTQLKSPKAINAGKSELSKDFKFIADLIIAQAETQIFYVSFGSFDTHANQQKNHDKLLSKFDTSFKEFISLLKNQDAFKDVCILIFSEFGRRVQENGSLGTDHGQANNVYVVSDHLDHAGIYNELDQLTDLQDGDIPFEIDFRQIYSSILEDWLVVNSESILNQNFKKLRIFNTRQITV